MNEGKTAIVTEITNDALRQKTNFVKKAFHIYAANGIAMYLGINLVVIVDAMIVGNVYGTLGLGVTSVATPLVLLSLIVSYALGMNGSEKISKCFGEDDLDAASKIFSRIILISLAFGGSIAALGAIFLRPLTAVLGGALLGEECRRYILTIAVFTPFIILQYILDFMLRSDSDPALATKASLCTCVLNVVLDILFVVILRIGVFGAALAYGLAVIAGNMVSLTHFLKKEAKLKLVRVSMPLRECAGLFAGGSGMASYYLWRMLAIMVFNNLLGKVSGNTGIAVFGMLYSLSSLTGSVSDGVNSALPPLVGMFEGERDHLSTEATMKSAARFLMKVCVPETLLIMIFAGPLARAFGMENSTAVPDAVAAIRIFALSLLPFCLNGIFAVYYQTTGRRFLCWLFNILKGVLVLFSVGIPLTLYFGVKGYAASLVVSEALTLIAVYVISGVVQKKRGLQNRLLLNDEKQLECFEMVLDSHFERLEEVVVKVTGICEKYNLPPRKTYYVQMTIEELAANIIKYGFGDGKEHFVAIKLAVYEGDVYLRLRDDSRTYNPFENRIASPDEDYDLENAVIDAVRKVSKEFTYRRHLTFNNLLIVL